VKNVSTDLAVHFENLSKLKIPVDEMEQGFVFSY
jgi:hypothetical protein